EAAGVEPLLHRVRGVRVGVASFVGPVARAGVQSGRGHHDVERVAALVDGDAIDLPSLDELMEETGAARDVTLPRPERQLVCEADDQVVWDVDGLVSGTRADV